MMKMNRERLPSAISDDDVDTNFHTEEIIDSPATALVTATNVALVTNTIHIDAADDDVTATNMQDLHSLFILAIEADRVDILQELIQSTTTSMTMQSHDDHNDENTTTKYKQKQRRDLLINPIIMLPTSTHAEVTSSTDKPTTGNQEQQQQQPYCCTTIPPLHIAIHFGSMNAINYLLRIGANPALRPNIARMMQLQREQAEGVGSTATKDNGGNDETVTMQLSSSTVFMLDVPHIQQYDHLTAWEVAFGRTHTGSDEHSSTTETSEHTNKKKASTNSSTWSSLFGNSSSSIHQDPNNNNNKNRPTSNRITPSKRESIRHAFMAEAIRCISNDDVDRLQQLVAAGMPLENKDDDDQDPTSSLWKWCTDFHATQCTELLQTYYPPKDNGTSNPSSNGDISSSNDLNQQQSDPPSQQQQQQHAARKTPVDSDEPATLQSLQNRYDELDALCRSLSLCLDNIAEEVSVGAGLLLNSGNGAQALASHVRTVKHQRQLLLDEYERNNDAYQNSIDELIYYIQQYKNLQRYGSKGGGNSNHHDHSIVDIHTINQWWSENISKNYGNIENIPVETLPASQTTSAHIGHNAEEEEDEQQKQRQQLITQIMMCEDKIRMLRTAMADLGDENTRNIQEITSRGLMSGIDYIRTLRNEIRDVEYHIYELKQWDVDCRTKIRTLQMRMNQANGGSGGSTNGNHNTSNPTTGMLPSNGNRSNNDVAPLVPESKYTDLLVTSAASTSTGVLVKDDNACHNTENLATSTTTMSSSSSAAIVHNSKEVVLDSERIQQGQSTALVLHGRTRGFLSLNLWQILLRIIGISSQRNESTYPDAPSVLTSQQSSSTRNTGSNRSDGGGNVPRSVLII
jgi:hypothetical protein